MNDEWGPWIEHDGKGRPVPVGTRLVVVWEGYPGQFHKEEHTCSSKPYSWDWSWWMLTAPCGTVVGRVIRYRVRRPRALLELIAMVEGLNVKVPEDA